MYLGDFVVDSTIYLMFTTSDASGGAVAPSSAFEAADIKIYKDNGVAEKTTTNGITMTSPFDGVTGLHAVTIDTSNDTGDAGFWVAESDYIVVLIPDETVDGQTVVRVLAQFGIANRHPSSSVPKNVALNNFQFLVVLSLDHVTPATGKTIVSQIASGGGAFANTTNSVAEIGNGVYKIDLTQTEMNADIITLKFTESTCDQRTITIKTSL